ncbi:flagellar biosynthesis protein FlhA [Sandaracinobacter neustonicus]|uniref:Flagellar biosynthesis protein FlhA n=1 Tax=Sandaracinobacter neustonicus TaxID=1715348 RepID=A0A501XER7_9SPHN|nr:flagellar biosynthesis protein FlhA [Sandaracinobacter neustonicus]TPE59062.1 flagellar biosynthesis protein FlhA [Sandaracinobacter neustonicus]
MPALISRLSLSTLPFASGRALLPVAMLAIVLLMVVPISSWMLDIFFIGNILLSLLMLMLVLEAKRPLDFSTFPTLLLVATLFRLALNVASTRVVLVHGHEGPAAAGHVIEAFGHALIGGNFVVGLMVFVILMIVNLSVIAKGAGRVSEVSARFTLDALPGKQMAIDADLSAGMLTPDEARARRADVAAEADFYGSMDGASKFVKGDAVAGILILLVNIFGGLAIGMLSHGLSFGEAADAYIILSIGDALVAQVPALLLSIGAAILVTRSADDHGLSSQLGRQVASASAWWPTAGVLGAMALVPGLPAMLLAPAAALAGTVAWRLRKRPEPVVEPIANAAPPAQLDWAEVTDSAPILIEIGYGLIPLVDAEGPLMTRITGIRRQLSQELGFVLPMARVRDNLGLAPQSYRISIAEELAGEGEAWPADLLALEAEAVTGEIPGRAVRDPAFGMTARWIDPSMEPQALDAGYTVVDSATVVGTHIYKLLKEHAHILFTQDDMQGLLDALGNRQPQLAASLSPRTVPLALTTQVAQSLLEEGVSLKGFPRIAAALSQHVGSVQDPALLVEAVRGRIGGLILSGIAPGGGALKLIALAPELESLLVAAHRAAPASDFPFEPGLGNRIMEAVLSAAGPLVAAGTPVILVTQPGPRRALWRLLRPHILIPVLGFPELQDHRAVEVVAVVSGDLANNPAPKPATMEPA